MADFDTLLIRIEADLSQFRREISETEKLATQMASRMSGSFGAFTLELNRSSQEVKALERNLARLTSGAQKKLAAPSKTGPSSAQPKMVSAGQGQGNVPRISNIQPAAVPSIAALILNQATLTVIRQVLIRIFEGIATGVAADQISKLMQSSGTEKGETLKQRLENQIGLLERIKGLNDPVAEVEESSRKLLKELTGVLESSRSRIASLTKQLQVTGDGKGPGFTFGGEGLVFSVEEEKSILRDLIDREKQLIEPLEGLAPILDRLIDAPARTFDSLEQFSPLSDCLQQLCDRLDSFGQDIPFDHASAGSGEGGQFLRASFDPADSPFGGAGLDGLNVELADAGWRVQDLSAGFVELTEASGGYEARAAALNALFGEQSGLIGQLLTQVPELGGQFSAFLERTSQEAGTLNQVVDAVGQSFLNAFEGAIQRGESLGDVLKSLIVDLAEIALRAAGNKFLELFLGSLFGASGPGPGAGPPIRFAQGAAFGPGGRFLSLAQGAAFGPGGRFLSLARGGAFMGAIVDTPTAFRFARGVGVMGEAGPEAVLPLTRLASGELGVKALMPRLPEAPAPAPAVPGPTFIIDARGADRESLRKVMALIQLVRREGMETRRMIGPLAISAVLDSRRRGGNIARAFGAR